MIEGEDPRAPKGSARYRRALIALFCAGVATFAQVYSPQALLPAIAREFGMSESSSSLAIGATTIGLAVGMLPWGRLSDRIGRVKTMRWAIVLAVCVGLVTPFMPTFEAFIGLRFLEGIMLAGLPAIGVTALAETVKPVALGGAVGAFIAGNTIGGLAGRIAAAGFGDAFGWHWGLVSVALLALIAAVGFLLLMPPTAVAPARGLPIWHSILANLRNPGAMVMVSQAFLLMGGFVATYNYLTFRLQQEPFGLSLTHASWLFLAYIAGAFASKQAWGLTKRIPPVGVLIGGICAMVVGLGLTLLPWLIAIIVGLVIFTVGFFGAHSIALTLVSLRSAPEARSLAPSVYNLAYYAGSTLLGWVGGFAFAAAGWGGTVAMVASVAILAASLAGAHASRNGGIRRVDAPRRA